MDNRHYTDSVTKMYGGTVMEVTLRCHISLVDNVIDKFGESVRISNVTQDSFDATASASVSGTFLSWVFQYAGQMHILSPERPAACTKKCSPQPWKAPAPAPKPKSRKRDGNCEKMYLLK